MGMPMEYNDALDHCNYVDQEYWSDLTDTESNDHYTFTPRAFEHIVPRSSKRTYGVFFASEAVLEQKKRSRINEQFELLRAAIPSSCTDVKASILTGAYEYIKKLERQVQDLQHELDAESCCEDDASYSDDDLSTCEVDLRQWFTEEKRPVGCNAASEAELTSCHGCPQPTVEVVQTQGRLKIHVECEKRSGLLVDIMEVLESSGLNVEQASITCQEHLVFDGVGSEVEEDDGAECRRVSYVNAEHVESRLRCLIVKQKD